MLQSLVGRVDTHGFTTGGNAQSPTPTGGAGLVVGALKTLFAFPSDGKTTGIVSPQAVVGAGAIGTNAASPQQLLKQQTAGGGIATGLDAAKQVQGLLSRSSGPDHPQGGGT
ncbi:hypothetical protein [Phenylobacterium hankyongense]|uniref:hypothetical protein n=1 Tax=Phenylobacterium hankyongense TaxID=1813876 RepID=UPI001A9EE3E2|nr:hypothetical protein [Phenylobacterium hankyongense]